MQSVEDIDGQRLSDEGSQGFSGRNLELTYAEVEFAPFCQLLNRVAQPQPGETFLDLGSGSGRAVLAAALAFPGLRCCRGYELLGPLHAAAERSAARVAELAGGQLAPVDLRMQSFLGPDAAWEE
ncbi:ANK1, partial [Symbiodinium pilosum]